MKVVLVFRQKRSGGYSIEELFRSIIKELNPNIHVQVFETQSRWHLPIDIFKLRQMNADVYHVTGDINYLVPLLPKNKTVLTVHDIYHYQVTLKGIKKYLYGLFWFSLPLRASTMITTISDATRQGILQYFSIQDEKLTVVGNCYSSQFKYTPKLFNIEKPVILQVGTKKNKNLSRLIEALSNIPCKLIIIGQLDSTIKEKLRYFNIEYENYINLTHQEIYKKYVECDIVSLVSLLEGFGVPIIEANAVGRLLITSDISPMSDIAGNAAHLVNPFEVNSIREGIEKIINDQIYRTQLIQNGLMNAKKYSPKQVAVKYHTLYENVRLMSAAKKNTR